MNKHCTAQRTTRPSGAREGGRPWWRGAVIYQIYPRSFCDTTGTGTGDLPGICKHLDYVADLGVDAVWLSPFFTSPMRDYGYDVADYCDVDPTFGTLADFDALVDKAHRLGLKVIIDQVYSHTSDQHPWFRESRQSRDNDKADWYVWADPKPDGSPPNNWQSVFGPPSWTWDARRGQYYLHNFLAAQPDLNVHNPDVQDAVLAAGKFWLDRGVDGFRLDALNFSMHDPDLRDNPPVADHKGKPPTRPFDFQDHRYNQSHADIPNFLQRIRQLTDQYDAVFTVAEIGGDEPLAEMKAFTDGDQHLNSAYNFDFLYAPDLTKAVVARALSGWSNAPGEGWPSWAFSNHDAPRAPTRWAGNRPLDDTAKLSLMLLMALRGNAFLYQGEELGLPQADVPREALLDPEAIANWPHTLGRDGARTPFPWTGEDGCGFSTGAPWLPIDPRHKAMSVAAQQSDPHSVLNFAKRLIAIRASSPALTAGTTHFAADDGPLLHFWRRADSESVACVFNLSAASVKRPCIDDADVLISVGTDPASDALPPGAAFLARAR